MAGFNEYYTEHMSRHSDPATRRYHFIGTGIAILLLVHMGCSGRLWLLPLVPLVYYSFSLLGHRIGADRDHQSFRRPLYSVLADLRMFWGVLEHRISIH